MIRNYSYKPAPVFHAARNEHTNANTRFFGTEVEMDYRSGVRLNISNRELSNKFDEIHPDFIYCKHDGSLSDNGLELVTHPGTLNYHMKECHWKHMTTQASKNGFRSHDSSKSCGFHVHVNRDSLGATDDERAETIRKMTYLIIKHAAPTIEFSRRNERAMELWAPIPSIPRGGVSAIPTYTPNHNDRYTALNVHNTNTVEFRIFRGTLRRDTIIASIQFCNNWCDYAMTHSWEECQNSTFDDIMNMHEYNELTQYLINRGLRSPDVPTLPNRRTCNFNREGTR